MYIVQLLPRRVWAGWRLHDRRLPWNNPNILISNLYHWVMWYLFLGKTTTTYPFGTLKSLNHVQPKKSPHPCLCACSDNFSGELQWPSWFVSPVETGKLPDRRKSIAGKFLCKCFFSIAMFDYRENHLSQSMRLSSRSKKPSRVTFVIFSYENPKCKIGEHVHFKRAQWISTCHFIHLRICE